MASTPTCRHSWGNVAAPPRPENWLSDIRSNRETRPGDGRFLPVGSHLPTRPSFRSPAAITATRSRRLSFVPYQRLSRGKAAAGGGSERVRAGNGAGQAQGAGLQVSASLYTMHPTLPFVAGSSAPPCPWQALPRTLAHLLRDFLFRVHVWMTEYRWGSLARPRASPGRGLWEQRADYF